jgi:hypothetical protein
LIDWPVVRKAGENVRDRAVTIGNAATIPLQGQVELRERSVDEREVRRIVFGRWYTSGSYM